MMNKSVILAVLAGCATGDGPTTTQVEDNALGVSYLRIDHQGAGAERVTDIRGFDANGQELASLILRVGEIRTSYDPGQVPDEISQGTDLRIHALGEPGDEHYATPGLERHTKPASPFPAHRQFVQLRAVADELAAVGISFVQAPEATGEKAYDSLDYGEGSDCSGMGSHFPSSVGVCARYYATGTRMFVEFSAGGTVAVRDIGATCRTAGGNTGCGAGAAPCYYGPCGTATNTWPEYSFILMYLSTSGSWWDIWLDSEHFDGLQSWPGISQSCTYTGCNTNGTPF